MSSANRPVTRLDDPLFRQLDLDGASHRSPAGPFPADDVERVRLPRDTAALLIIDAQRSFTAGVWMQSMGPDGERQVEPIRLAFSRLAHLLGEEPPSDVMFTRCPFPPDSYGWDAALDDMIHPRQPYFIKPGNSVLWPPDNGFTGWVERLLRRRRRTLVLAGCTLNSCVRVSAIDTQRRFGGELQVVVDPALCGARRDNYLPAPQFGGRSSVESALDQMRLAGVRVAQIDWC